MHPIKIRCAFVYKLIFTLYVFSSSLITYSQKVEVKLKDNTEFNRALSGSGAQKIRKAGKYFHKAELTMEKVRVYDREIQDIQNNSRRAKTRKVTKLEGGKMQKEIDAYYFYNQAHKKLYSLYKKSLKQFRLMSANPDEGKQIEKNSSNAYKKSKKQRRKAENKDKTEKAYPFYADAYMYEVNAINYQIDAFAHYQATAIPATVEEIPEEGFVPEDSLEQNIIAEELTDTIIAIEPELPAETLPEVVLPEVDSSGIAELIADSLVSDDVAILSYAALPEVPPDTMLVADLDTLTTDTLNLETLTFAPEEPDPAVTVPVEEPEPPAFEIFFGIQILSRTSPATDAQLRQVYQGPEKPYLMQNNGYYRYLVGKFDTLSEVKTFKNNKQLEGFIVSYKDGERIPVQEAIELLKEKD